MVVDLKSILRDVINNVLEIGFWHVSPGQAGWTPHRDSQANCLFPDRKPKSLTCWLPLNQAQPINSCMYIIPADRDQGYGLSGPGGENISPAARMADIRALPGAAGDVFAWTQHAFHWGSHSADEHQLASRMSIAFEFQRLDVASFNAPLLAMNSLPTFEQRLALIAKQVDQYTHMYSFGADLIALAKKIGQSNELPESVHFQQK